MSLGFCYDLAIDSFFDTSVAIAGILSCVYFFGAGLFGVFRFFLKIYVIPGSYLTAGISSLINSFITLFAATVVENSFLLEKMERLGPSDNAKNHLILLAMIFFPLQLLETLAISAKAKIATNQGNIPTGFKKHLFEKSYFLIPVILVSMSIIGIFQLPEATKYAVFSESLISISAFHKAEEYLDKGMIKNADNARLCSLKSILLIENINFSDKNHSLDKNAEALKFSEKAVLLMPESPLYKYRLSAMLEMNHNPERAINMASEAVSLANNDPMLWQYLADLNQKHKHYDEAINAYNKSIEIDPNNALVINNLAYTLIISKKDYYSALQLAKRSVELLPSSVACIDTLAWAYYKNKNYQEALETIKILYNDRTEISPEIDFHYAAILNEMGLLNNPVETFDKMIVKPEIMLNQSLILEMIEERQKAEEKSRKNK